MARRTKRTNAKDDQETGVVTPDLQDEGQVEGMETNVSDTQEGSVESVTVNENRDGEATNGTTKQGDESPVQNTDKIPQNGVTEIEVLKVTDNEVATQADEDRTVEEVKFADESNPNQKGRNASAPTEYDQDGNLRTDGYSYGVAPDDTRGIDVDEAFEPNRGEKPEENDDEKFDGKRVFVAKSEQVDTVNTEDTNVEYTPEEVEKLEEELSRPDEGISARVTSSTGSYFRIKFFLNNKPFVTYKARTNKLDKGEVNAFVDSALEAEA